MSKQLLQQLKNLKHDPRAGSASSIERLNARSKMLQAIGHELLESTKETREWQPAYIRFTIGEIISAPVPVAVTVLFVLLGGWLTSVNAASSLPGDKLYSVKIATEKAQLTLTSREHKAVLHTEFAERRLGEAVAIQASDRPDKEKYYSETLSAFKTEVSRAGEGIKGLANDNDKDALAVATKVDEKIGTLNESLRGHIGISESTNTQVVETQESTREVSHQVENTIVEKKQEVGEQVVRSDMETRIRKSVNAVTIRQTHLLARLNVLQRAATLQNVQVTIDPTLTYRIESLADDVPEAMNLLVAGGYSDALAVMREIDKQLLALELEIAELEVAISTAVQAQIKESSL